MAYTLNGILESELGSGIVSASFSGNDFYYGLGAQYNFTESFFGTLEYYSSKVDVDGTDVDLSTIGISVGMKF